MKCLLIAGVAAFLATNATAECPAKPPSIKWNTHSSDKKVDDAYLQKLLTGRKVKFQYGGTEHYKKNGSYRYSDSSGSYTAKSYKFYSSGVRCIGYPTARFDRYVVDGKTLVLINSVGGRYEAKVK